MKNIIRLFTLVFVISGFVSADFAQVEKLKLPAGVSIASKEQVAQVKQRALQFKQARSIASSNVVTATTNSEKAEAVDGFNQPNSSFIIDVVGNSYTNITATACNTRPIPGDSLILATEGLPDGGQAYKVSLYAFEKIPAGDLCYPVSSRKYDWSDFEGIVNYEVDMYNYDTGQFLSQTTVQKAINKSWSGNQSTPQLIAHGFTQTIGGLTFLKLEGRIVNASGVSIRIRDADMDSYSGVQVPKQAISVSGKQILVNLKLVPGFLFTPDEVVIVFATTNDGLTGQREVVIGSQ